jgi:prepilin-type N-terminal cleavage/methylation domain-containing protein
MKLGMNIHNQNKGFTLIELLVVIAIIGILASVVLASLNTARDKGANAALKANFSGARAQAQLYWDDSNNLYEIDDATNSVCINDTTDAARGLLDMIVTADAQNGGGAVICNDTPTEWAVAVQLVGDSVGDYYCVDSTGDAVITASVVGVDFTTETACP